MRILFVSTNRFRIELALPMPIGLACVIGQIDESRHAIRVLDLMFCERPEVDLERALSEFEPDMVALSIRNIDNQSRVDTRYFLPEARQMIDLCRASAPDATVVVGGAAFSAVPAAAFDFLEPDFGIAGEGEAAFPLLVECLEGGRDPGHVPGLVWRSPEGTRANAPACVEDWDALRFPRRDLFDTQRYAQSGGFANIVIKQGCPMRCLYCDDPHRLGRRQRGKSPARIAEELEAMSREIGDGPIFFSDTIFNSPKSHAKKVCRAIIDRGLSPRWTAAVHPAFIDEELVRLMRQAGCFAVSLGSDSCSDRILKALRKDFTKQQLDDATRLLEEFEIGYLLTILVGAPGEDRESVEETVDFLAGKNPLLVSFTVGIRILPHTALAQLAVEEGLIRADDPLMEPKFYLSPNVEGWVEPYLAEVCSQHESWNFAQQLLQTRADLG